MKKIYALLMLTLPFLGFAQNTHVVTFKVNTANITVGASGLYLGVVSLETPWPFN